MKCPTCGHTPTTKRQKPIDAIDANNVDTLDEIGRRAYYTRTAPFYDVQFMIDNGRGLSVGLLEDARALAATVHASGRFSPGTTRASFYRQYFALSARRRGEREDRHYRRIVVPAQKARAWADAFAHVTPSIGTMIAAQMMIRAVFARTARECHDGAIAA